MNCNALKKNFSINRLVKQNFQKKTWIKEAVSKFKLDIRNLGSISQILMMINFLFILFLSLFLFFSLKYIGPLVIKGMVTLDQFGFSVAIPISIIISSVSVILILNPIYALLGLMIVFLTTAIFLISINIQYLAFIYLVVYVGAISMFFLFVIMLVNLRNLHKNLNSNRISFLETSLLCYLILGVKFFMVISSEIKRLSAVSGYNYFTEAKRFDLQYFTNYIYLDIGIFTNLFYTYYLYLFLLSGFLLLISMVGSIVLAMSAVK